jgi:hypothetical protein
MSRSLLAWIAGILLIAVLSGKQRSLPVMSLTVRSIFD